MSPLVSDTSWSIIFEVRFPSLQLYSRSDHRSFHPSKMQYDSYVCQFAATNLSVNMAIAGHESVEVNYRGTIPHTTIWKKKSFPYACSNIYGVLFITYFEDLQCRELWFRTGAKERLRFIPIHRLHSSLGQPLCKALPAFHALTGCYSTSALQGIGKTTALKILLKDNGFQQRLSHLSFGAGPAVSNESLVSSEAFICSLYNRGDRLTKADEVRYLLFF